MTVIRTNFGAIAPPPAPFYVGWLESSEMYFVFSDEHPDLEDGPYVDKWRARRVAILHAKVAAS